LGKDYELIINAKGYSIEIKNVIAGKGNVRMSIRQGITAVKEKESYALCVMTRPNDDQIIDKDYFIENSSFVVDIGNQIGDKIINWESGLKDLDLHADIKVLLEERKESVYVSKNIWGSGIPFSDFVSKLKEYFSS